jgi:hypothetical protein
LVAEVLPQPVILDIVPADPHPEPHAAAAEYVDLRRLLGDERRLPLRENEHPGYQLQSLRDRRHKPEQHEDLVKRVTQAVTIAPVRSVRDVGTQHVVIGKEGLETHAFDRLGKIADRDRVVAELGLGKGDSEFHD